VNTLIEKPGWSPANADGDEIRSKRLAVAAQAAKYLPDLNLNFPRNLSIRDNCISSPFLTSVIYEYCVRSHQMRGHLAPRERLKAGEPIGTTERNKRPVTETLGVWPADPLAVAWKPAGSPGCTVKPFARVDAVRDEFLARSLDVGDGQKQALSRTGRGRREVHAELDRAAGTGRRELEKAKVVTCGAVGVEPPPEP
jgi:hypothetical protein